MKNVSLTSACKIRANIFDLGIISMVPRPKSESRDIELADEEGIQGGKI